MYQQQYMKQWYHKSSDIFPLRQLTSLLEDACLHIIQLLHPVGQLKELWQLVVHARNHLVDCLFPRLLLVLARHDGFEEFPQG